MGCYKNSGTCYIKVSGNAVGPHECASKSVRWDINKDANGKAAFSLFTAAHFSGKKVKLKMSDNCYQGKTKFPTFNQYHTSS